MCANMDDDRQRPSGAFCLFSPIVYFVLQFSFYWKCFRNSNGNQIHHWLPLMPLYSKNLIVKQLKTQTNTHSHTLNSVHIFSVIRCVKKGWDWGETHQSIYTINQYSIRLILFLPIYFPIRVCTVYLYIHKRAIGILYSSLFMWVCVCMWIKSEQHPYTST